MFKGMYARMWIYGGRVRCAWIALMGGAGGFFALSAPLPSSVHESMVCLRARARTFNPKHKNKKN
jgi:hypothetical protein